MTARLTGASYTAWQTLLAYADKHGKSKSTVAKMAVLSLLALHLPAKPNGALADVIVLRPTLGGQGTDEGLPLWKCLGTTPPHGVVIPDVVAAPSSLLQIERRGEELDGGQETVSVRFSDEWAARWKALEMSLPGLLPGQILAEAIRVAAVVLGGAEDGRRVVIRLPDGHQEELGRFLGFADPSTEPAKSAREDAPKRQGRQGRRKAA